MVANDEANPFPMGSREHIAFAFADELKREAASDSETPLARQARRIFPASPATTRRVARADVDAVATEPPAATPPIPARKPEQEATETSPVAAPPTPTAKPKVPYQELWHPDQLLRVSDDFAWKIDQQETSEGRWDKVHPSTDAAGRYQLTPVALDDIGLVDGNGEWYGHPYPDLEEFLGSPQLQNLALAACLKVTQGYLTQTYTREVEPGNSEEVSPYDFLGQEIEGKVRTFEVTESGLLAAAHRWGAGNVLAYLLHQRENKWVTDEEGFGGKKDVFLAIETRLREFQPIPLYPQPDSPPLNDPNLLI
ncbi:MAG: hypothetical protein AAF563_13330 [Pseudomonadota bacterium]